MKLGENFEFTENLKQAGLVLGLAGALNACGGKTSADIQGVYVPTGGELPVMTGGTGGGTGGVEQTGSAGIEQGGVAGNGGFEQAGAGGEGGIEEIQADLLVKIDPYYQQSSSVPRYASLIVPGCFDFVTNDQAVVINDLVFTRKGYGKPSDFESLYLSHNGVRLTEAHQIDPVSNQVTFANRGFYLDSGTINRYCLIGSLSKTAEQGSIHQFEISSSADIHTSEPISIREGFPVKGSELLIVGAETGSVEINANGILNDIVAGADDAVIAQFELAVNIKEEQTFVNIVLKMEGTFDLTDLSEFKLVSVWNNKVLDEGTSVGSNRFEFEPSSIDDVYLDGFPFNSPYVFAVTADVALDAKAGSIKTYLEETIDLNSASIVYGNSSYVDSSGYDGSEPGNYSQVRNLGSEDFNFEDVSYYFVEGAGAYPDVFDLKNRNAKIIGLPLQGPQIPINSD